MFRSLFILPAILLTVNVEHFPTSAQVVINVCPHSIKKSMHIKFSVNSFVLKEIFDFFIVLFCLSHCLC